MAHDSRHWHWPGRGSGSSARGQLEYRNGSNHILRLRVQTACRSCHFLDERRILLRGLVHLGNGFTEAAIRELREETGMVVTSVGAPVARREFTMRLPDGEDVVSEEQYFVVRTAVQDICRDQNTALEIEVMADHKWWTAADLESTNDTVWPDNLPEMLRSTGRW